MGDKKRHYLFPPGDPKKTERDFGVTDENRDALAERGRLALERANILRVPEKKHGG